MIFGHPKWLPAAVLLVTVTSGSGASQMPTRPSSASSASTLRGGGGGANLRNASVTFSIFSMKFLWDDINNIS